MGRMIQAHSKRLKDEDIAASSVSHAKAIGMCDKCDGPHAAERCPFFTSGREDHKDAWANYGHQNPLKMGCDCGAFVLRKARVVRQPGDGSCLFHSMAFGLLEACSEKTTASVLRD